MIVFYASGRDVPELVELTYYAATHWTVYHYLVTDITSTAQELGQSFREERACLINHSRGLTTHEIDTKTEIGFCGETFRHRDLSFVTNKCYGDLSVHH